MTQDIAPAQTWMAVRSMPNCTMLLNLTRATRVLKERQWKLWWQRWPRFQPVKKPSVVLALHQIKLTFGQFFAASGVRYSYSRLNIQNKSLVRPLCLSHCWSVAQCLIPLKQLNQWFHVDFNLKAKQTHTVFYVKAECSRGSSSGNSSWL